MKPTPSAPGLVARLPAGRPRLFSADSAAAGRFSLQAIRDGRATAVVGPVHLVEDGVLNTDFPQP